MSTTDTFDADAAREAIQRAAPYLQDPITRLAHDHLCLTLAEVEHLRGELELCADEKKKWVSRHDEEVGRANTAESALATEQAAHAQTREAHMAITRRYNQQSDELEIANATIRGCNRNLAETQRERDAEVARLTNELGSTEIRRQNAARAYIEKSNECDALRAELARLGPVEWIVLHSTSHPYWVYTKNIKDVEAWTSEGFTVRRVRVLND